MPKHLIYFATIYLSAFIFYSCAPSRFIKPLNKKQQAINLSAGGPLINYSDITIPVPFVTATYGYGIDSSLTGFGSVNLTSALYGNAQIELGVVKNLIKQKGNLPAISFSPVANIIYRHGTQLKIYPQVDVNAWWDFNHYRNLFYAGISNWFELSGKKSSGLKQQNHWLLSPMLGHIFQRRKWDFIVEVKAIAPNLKNNYNTVDYKTPFGNNGAFGFYIGYTRKF